MPTDLTDAEYDRREQALEAAGHTVSDRIWFAYCRNIERLLGIKTLDGDYEEDGYSLDHAHGLFVNGTSAIDAAYFFTIRMRAIAKAAESAP